MVNARRGVSQRATPPNNSSARASVHGRRLQPAKSSEADGARTRNHWIDSPVCHRGTIATGIEARGNRAGTIRPTASRCNRRGFLAGPKGKPILDRVGDRGRAGLKGQRMTTDWDAEPDATPIEQVEEMAAKILEDAGTERRFVLTFSEFRRANRRRAIRWHADGIEGWSSSDWITAICGELGELASLVKMRNRERDGLVGNKFSPTADQLASEIADVAIYLDIFAESVGVDLGEAIRRKFNEVSERNGFPERL